MRGDRLEGPAGGGPEMSRGFRGVATVSAAVTTAVALLIAMPAAAGSPVSPSISSFGPAAGSVGSTVTIDGSGFSSATGVTFNFNPAAFAIVSDSEITATVPLGEDRGPIAVTGPGGTSMSASSFSLLGFYVTTTVLAGGRRGFPYSVQLEAAGGTAPYRWSRTGTLPKGLTLSRTGLLSASVINIKKATPGTYTFSVRARDSTRHGHLVATRALSLDVS